MTSAHLLKRSAIVTPGQHRRGGDKTGSESVASPGATPGMFALLGVRPLVGRTFSKEEGQSGGPESVLLSEGLWRETFHADPGNRRPENPG